MIVKDGKVKCNRTATNKQIKKKKYTHTLENIMKIVHGNTKLV